jgi:hypothetical protein
VVPGAESNIFIIVLIYHSFYSNYWLKANIEANNCRATLSKGNHQAEFFPALGMVSSRGLGRAEIIKKAVTRIEVFGEQIIAILREQEAGVPRQAACRSATFYACPLATAARMTDTKPILIENVELQGIPGQSEVETCGPDTLGHPLSRG